MTLFDLLATRTGDPETTFGAHLAELLYKNGGQMRVSGWGVIELGGIYGAMGLEQEEALELIHLGGVIRGFLMNAPAGSDHTLKEWIEAEWKRIEAKVGGK
jgi:hypothetical protein